MGYVFDKCSNVTLAISTPPSVNSIPYFSIKVSFVQSLTCRQKYAGCQTCESGGECARQGVPGSSDTCGHKVYAHCVEDRFGTAHGDRGDPPEKRIGPEIFVDVKKEPGGGRGGEHLDDGERDELPRETDMGRKPPDQDCQKIEETGGPQDTYGSHQPDQCRHEADDSEKSAAGAFDEGVVDIDPGQKSVDHYCQYDKWDDKIGDID